MVATTRPNPNPAAPDIGRDGDGFPGRRLYLVVDNTRAHAGVDADVDGGGERSGGKTPGGETADGDLGRGEVEVPVLSSLRYARQFLVNRFGRLGLLDRLAHHVPTVMLATAVIFGSLLALRLAQESPSSSLAGQSSSTSGQSAPAPIAASGPDSLLGDDQIVVVQAGDTLWSIANDRFPNQDPRAVVEALADANGGAVVEVGQPLVVPGSLIDQ